MLSAPPFVKTSIDVMRAVVYNPGVKETAGILNHTQGWAVIAECLLGHGNRAYPYYRTSMPAAYNVRAEIRQTEPVVKGQTTYSIYAPHAGNARTPQQDARNRAQESGPRLPRRQDGHPQRPNPLRQPRPADRLKDRNRGKAVLGMCQSPVPDGTAQTESPTPSPSAFIGLIVLASRCG